MTVRGGSKLDADAGSIFNADLQEKLVRFIQDQAIIFYRDIGSHDFSGFPGVREEFLYLVLFATECRLKSLLGSSCACQAISSLRIHLSSFLCQHDGKLEQGPFWDRYEQRAALYNSQLSADSDLSRNENIISAFSANVMSRLHDWPALVSHHSANAAMTVLSELCGTASF